MPDVFHFSNNSIAGIFFAMLLLFIVSFLFRPHGARVYVLLWIAIAALASLLVMSNSRAGWLGFATGLSYIIWQRMSQKRRTIFLVLACSFLALFFLLLFFYKPGSSSGRKHIYQLSAVMWRDHWLHGVGLGKFKARFNEYQADYFSAHDIDSQRAFLADNTFYAFNDYLQWVIETGLAGLVILLAAIYFIVRRIALFHRKGLSTSVMIMAATASLLSVAVAALFSYPLQCVPVQALVLACLGIIVFYPLPQSHATASQRTVRTLLQVMLAALLVLFVMKVIRERHRSHLEKVAFDLAQSGYKTAAVAQYRQLAEQYPETGYNSYLYAEQLYYINQLPAALDALRQGMVHYTDNKMYKLKGDIELELHKYEQAEQSYLRAMYMVPNRMGSRLDLMNFYLNRQDTANAMYWAGSILNMRIKIPSKKVEQMLQSVKRIHKELKYR